MGNGDSEDRGVRFKRGRDPEREIETEPRDR